MAFAFNDKKFNEFRELPEGHYAIQAHYYEYTKQSKPLSTTTGGKLHMLLEDQNTKTQHHAISEYDRYVEQLLNLLQTHAIPLHITDAPKPEAPIFKPPSRASASFFSRIDKRQSFLLPNTDYDIKEVKTHENLHAVDILLEGQHQINNGEASGEEYEKEKTAFTLFTSKEYPNAMRFYEYIHSRLEAGIPLIVTEPISTVVETDDLNVLFKSMHRLNEVPLIKAGKIYVLDDVIAYGNQSVKLGFHNYYRDEEFRKLRHSVMNDTLRNGEVPLFQSERDELNGATFINTFSDKSEAIAAYGRWQGDIYSYFNGKLEKGQRIFRSIDDLYSSSLDFMIRPDASPTIPSIFIFRSYDRDKKIRDAIAEELRNRQFPQAYNIRVTGAGKNEIIPNPSLVP